METPKVSVIVPVYGTEEYLRNCLNSICTQTYRNLEIIAVNDCTPDNSRQILDEFQRKDSRLIVVNHEKNEGLYKARISGVEKATGKYVCFVDSDDEIAIDWIRNLLLTAEKEHSDIVVGNTVNVDESGRKFYYNNSISFTRFNEPLCGKDILDKFFEQEGACYHWHTIWNKLYSIDLWKKALPFLKKQSERLVMTEDILFTTVLFSFAQKLSFKDCDCYFYYKRKGASTDNAGNTDKVIKAVTDIGKVFDFLEQFFKNGIQDESRLAGLAALKDKYYRIWCHTIIASYNKNIILQNAIKKAFRKDALCDSHPDDFYFYQVSTDWNNNYENIKQMIANSKFKVISFDIFDTLVIRPLYEPDDIFVLMSKQAAKMIGISNSSQFCMMRKNAENLARQAADKGREDITLTEIYDKFGEIYGVSNTVCKGLYDLEITYEKRYCYRRESGVELLEMAKAIGKRVVLTSDMYLELDVVKNILNGLSITGYDAIYLSSDVGYLKSTGNLYRYMYRHENVDPNKIIHIGDNWQIDIERARFVGLEALFFAKAKEIAFNKIANIPVGNFMAAFSENNSSWERTSLATKDFPIRSLLAMVANKFFDRPNYSFQSKSDYNGDMYLIGYYCVGFFLLGLSKWLQKRCLEKGINNLKFLARDGFMPKMAFDKLSNKDVRYSGISTDYFYASRKSLMPFAMDSELDFYSIPTYINLTAHTPSSILRLLGHAIPAIDDIKEKYKAHGIDIDKKFANYEEFCKFINAFLKVSYNKEYYQAHKTVIESYFKKSFEGNTAVFDLGYSGKLPLIINKLCGKRVDTFFVHRAAGATKLANDNNFVIENFLDFSPAISGVVLEYFISSISGSCIGYQQDGSTIEPITEENSVSYETAYPIITIQKGVRDFIDDFIAYFGDVLEEFEFNNYEIFAPMLYYLCGAKEFDIYFFNYTKLEDELYGARAEIPFLEIYEHYYRESKLDSTGNTHNSPAVVYRNTFGLPNEWSRIKKALFYFFFDNKTFWSKLKSIVLHK